MTEQEITDLKAAITSAGGKAKETTNGSCRVIMVSYGEVDPTSEDGQAIREAITTLRTNPDLLVTEAKNKADMGDRSSEDFSS